jgi:5-methylcytosine-specific restriction endonuclease McrA
MTAEQRKVRRDRLRAEWIEANGPCRHCGSRDDLQIDHVDPAAKSFTINFERRLADVYAELAKCQVLCKPCHKAKTAADIAATGVCRRGHQRTAANRITTRVGDKCRECQQRANREYMRRVRLGL